MLTEHNKQVINKLAKHTIRNNRSQFGLLFVTVFLSAFMMLTVFTVGITYLDLSRLQNTRLYGSEYDIAVLNGYTQEQKESLNANRKIASVGSLIYAGRVIGTEKDDTVNTGLLWCDKDFWEKQKPPAVTKLSGKYPQKENELLVTRQALKECGEESLTTGSSFVMTYEDNRGIHTKEFIISGIWEGYGNDKENFYVSDIFFQKSGFDLETSGILQIKFKRNYVAQKTIEEVENSLNLTQQQVFQPSEYIESSLKILAAVCGLCLIICISMYLLVYNILYLFVTGKIRYYGLLQAVGMTKKQLLVIVRKQMGFTGILGIGAGIFLGIGVSLLGVPYVMDFMGMPLEGAKINVSLPVVFLSIFVSGISLYCGVRTPIRTAVNTVPGEAVRFRGSKDIRPVRRISVKNRKGKLYWRMAIDQLRKDWKKTIIVFLSLGASLTVFYCLTTIISSQGERRVYPNYWDADVILQNDTQTTENIESLEPGITEGLISEVKSCQGVRETHVVRGIPVLFPYKEGSFSEHWMKNYVSVKPYMSYTETISDYEKNPEKYYGMLKGIDEAEFAYLNETLGNSVDRKAFLEGNICILQYGGFEVPEDSLEEPIVFQIDEKQYEIQAVAVNYEGYYGASANVGPNLIVSEQFLESLDENALILSALFKYQESYDWDTEKTIQGIVEKSGYKEDIIWTSKYEEMKRIEEAQGSMYGVGTLIALLLLLTGLLNYRNTMSGSIQNRRQTFSIMESVGMSRKQLRKLFIREGLLYGAGSVFITGTVGTGITYFAFQSMNYMRVPFRIPVIPVFMAALLIMAICAATPLISYKRIVGKASIAERMRNYE